MGGAFFIASAVTTAARRLCHCAFSAAALCLTVQSAVLRPVGRHSNRAGGLADFFPATLVYTEGGVGSERAFRQLAADD